MAKDPKLNPKIEGFTFADGACKRFSKKTNNKCLVLYGNSVQIYRFIWFGKNSMTWNYFRTLKECMAGNKNIFCGHWSVQCHSILFKMFYCIFFRFIFQRALTAASTVCTTSTSTSSTSQTRTRQTHKFKFQFQLQICGKLYCLFKFRFLGHDGRDV